MITLALWKVLRAVVGTILSLFVFVACFVVLMLSPSMWREARKDFLPDMYDVFLLLALGIDNE